MDHIVMARKRNIRCSLSQKSLKRRPVKTVTGNFQSLFTLSEDKNQRKVLEGKYKEQPKIAIDGTEHMVRTTDTRILHLKLISALFSFQKSQKKVTSPNKQSLRGPGGKYVSASEKTQKLEESINFESESKVWKAESEEKDSDFECLIRPTVSRCRQTFTEKLLEVAKKEPTLELLPNRSEEEEINNNGETVVGNGFWNRILPYADLIEQLNHRSGWVVYHISEPKITYTFSTEPTRKKPPRPEPIPKTKQEIDSDDDLMEYN